MKRLDDEESTVVKRLSSDNDSTTLNSESSAVASSNLQSSIRVTYNKEDHDDDCPDTWDGSPMADINSSCDHGNDEGNCQQVDNQSHATPSHTQAVPNLCQQDFSTPSPRSISPFQQDHLSLPCDPQCMMHSQQAYSSGCNTTPV